MGIALVVSGDRIKSLSDRDLEGLSMWFGSLGVQLEKGGARISAPLKDVVDMMGSLVIFLHQNRYAKKPDPPSAIVDVSPLGRVDDIELMFLDGILRGEADRLHTARNSAASAFLRDVMVPIGKERAGRH